MKVKAVNGVSDVHHGSVGLPSQSEIERQTGRRAPVVLNEGGEIPTGAIQLVGLLLGERCGKTNQERGEPVARGRIAGQAGRLRRKTECAGDGRQIHLVVTRAARLESELACMLAANGR